MKRMQSDECRVQSSAGQSAPRSDRPLQFSTLHSSLSIIALALLLLAATALPAGAQNAGAGAAPLRKTDLIRLLTGSALTPAQVAAEVQQNCLAFTPTARDRANLVALGADSTVMARIDSCARARAAAVVRRPAAAAPPVAAAPAPAPPAPPAPPDPVASARLVAVPLASRVQVPVRGTAVVNVALKRGSDAVAGARLVLLGSARFAGDGAADATAVTDERGLAQFRFPAGGTAGTFRLAVWVDGDSLAVPAELQLSVVAPIVAVPPPAPRPPAAPLPAADRTGFVLGMAQRGRVGETAPLPVVFEVRDSGGAAIPGVAVSLSAVNGRLLGAQPTTDAQGQVRAQVVFGERAGVPTVISGTVGSIVRQATLFPTAAPPSRLVVLLDGNAMAGQVVLLASRAAQLRIFCRDRFGNPVALAGLQAAVGDERVLRVTDVTSDTLGGEVTVTAGKAGSTNLVIQGSGLRADFSALVR